MSKSHDKYALYEASVQAPHDQARIFSLIYTDLFGKKAHLLREDFCGTFLNSIEWVKLDDQNKSLCLDLDSSCLNYGKKNHYKKLTPSQKSRLKILKQNVMSSTSPKADIIGACNFSFFLFKEKETLTQYFKKALQSLKKQGVLVLEMAGGPGMIETLSERKIVNTPKTGRFTYIWQQKQYNPISQEGFYSIHFKLKNGTYLRNAFVYDWRIWGVREVREALSAAGFKSSVVYWETDRKAALGEFEYIRSEKAYNAHAWLCFVVGIK